jgi:hypothetical protein
MTSGYMKIKGPEDLEKALGRMLNKILLSDDPLLHAQKFASLANAWINAKRLDLESTEWKKFKEEFDEFREQVERNQQQRR